MRNDLSWLRWLRLSQKLFYLQFYSASDCLRTPHSILLSSPRARRGSWGEHSRGHFCPPPPAPLSTETHTKKKVCSLLLLFLDGFFGKYRTANITTVHTLLSTSPPLSRRYTGRRLGETFFSFATSMLNLPATECTFPVPIQSTLSFN